MEIDSTPAHCRPVEGCVIEGAQGVAIGETESATRIMERNLNPWSAWMLTAAPTEDSYRILFRKLQNT